MVYPDLPHLRASYMCELTQAKSSGVFDDLHCIRQSVDSVGENGNAELTEIVLG